MLISRISGCKISANRAKFQIFLRISEVQPNFKPRSRLKVVQLTHERARAKLAWVLEASEKEESVAKSNETPNINGEK